MKKVLAVCTMMAVCLCLIGTAAAEQRVDPQYHNQGRIGSEDRTWKKSYVRDTHLQGPVFPKKCTVNSYTQLSAVGGASVFMVDLTLGNEFEIDLDAIYASCSPIGTTGTTTFRNVGLATGVTVVGPIPDSDNTRAEFTITVKTNGAGETVSGTSTVVFWVPQESGDTPFGNVLAVYPTGTSAYAAASSVSDYQLDQVGESRTYQVNNESGVSYAVKRMVSFNP